MGGGQRGDDLAGRVDPALRLARAAGFNEFVKLEVIGDETTLLPDVYGTLEAARTLSDEGFKVMAYTNDDLVTALRLEDAGLEGGRHARQS